MEELERHKQRIRDFIAQMPDDDKARAVLSGQGIVLEDGEPRLGAPDAIWLRLYACNGPAAFARCFDDTVEDMLLDLARSLASRGPG